MKSLNDIIKLAHETLAKNQDTLVAKFVLENPSAKAEDIELCTQYKPTEIVYWVRLKSQAEVSSAEFDTNLFIASHMARTGIEPTYEEVVSAALSAMKSEIKELHIINNRALSSEPFKEIDKLRTENAILREALTEISKTNLIGANIYAGADDIIFTAREALTAADKVRGEG